jgi:hypothetical protein
VAGEKDVMGKADALLQRHAVGTETGGVPVLTDFRPRSSGQGARGRSRARRLQSRDGEVEGRLAADLEKRLVQHLVPQVHTAVASALGDLHQELANAIGDAVAAALRDRQLK